MSIQHIAPERGTEKQPFIPYVTSEKYPERLKPILEPYMKRMGFLPNALKLYMHRPEIAETLWKLNGNIMRDPTSTLDQNLKRRLAAVASRVNGCTYCLAHHCSMLKKPPSETAEGWGMSHEELHGLISGSLEPENEMERACFDFVRASSTDAGSVPDEVYEGLNAHLTPPQIVELACVVGFWKFYNTVHDALRIPLEGVLEGEMQYIHS